MNTVRTLQHISDDRMETGKESVNVYTNINGSTITVEGEDPKAAALVLAEEMLNDLLFLSEDPEKDPKLAGIEGVVDEKYATAFTLMMYAIQNNTGIPAPIFEAVESLEKNEDYISRACNAMDENAVFPASSAYTELRRVKYYLSKWKRQLQVLMSIAA